MSTNQEYADHHLLLKRALARIGELEARLAEASRAAREPVAIVGLGCRFPGGADSPETFWRLLRAGRDAVGETPPERWDSDAFFDPNPDAPGRMYTRCGAFVERVDEFDPQFFGISPREATAMDPQQRLLLEVAWEALEDAALNPGRLAGSRTGVFIGMTGQDYAFLQMGGDLTAVDAYSAIGTAHSIAAGRLAYVLGLEGPCLVLDTACSSALVAVHLACRSLRTGESELALAGSVNLMLAPTGTITTCKARMLSPGGRCKTFDASADGYVRGEGCGMVALKLLSRALADGDPIQAVIRGSAINQDGRSNGLTAPNGRAQMSVIQTALADAGLEARQIHYVEAHGTGTSLGDPIELRALVQALGEGRSPASPLWVGSVKTNIGHLEPAAGIAGLIKIVLALQAREIPPHLHLHEPNPCIDWATAGLRVPGEPIPWPAGEQPRAGINSFGFSGTNAHLIVEAAPAPRVTDALRNGRSCDIFTLSAKSAQALDALARRYADYLDAHPETVLRDLCATANGGRNTFGHRLAAVVSSTEALRDILRSAPGNSTAPVMRGEANGSLDKAIAFIFLEEGAAELIEAGRALQSMLPLFRTELVRCQALCREHLEAPLLEALLAAPDSPAARLMEHPRFIRSALVALQWSLAAQWRAWGITPAACLGQGVGELAAAAVAGALTLEEALRLACAQGDRDALARAVADLVPHPLATGLVQSLNGELWSGGQGPAGDYWLEQSCRPVASLAAGLATLHAAGCRAFLELGTGGLPEGAAPGAGTFCMCSLPRGRGAWAGLLEAAEHLWVAGAPLRLDALGAPGARRISGLPTYPFQRHRYWFAEHTRRPDVPPTDPAAHPPQFAATLSPGSLSYGVRWMPSPAAAPQTAGEPAGCWVILASRTSLGQALAENLRQRGDPCRLAQAGESNLAQVLHELDATASEATPLRGVIDLRGLDAPADGAAELPEAPRLACLDLLGVVRELNAARLPMRLRLWVVTRGAQDFGPAGLGRAGLVQAPLLGLSRVVALEHPELLVTRLDLDATPDTDESGLLAEEILAASGEDTVAWRGGERFVARLEHLPSAPHIVPSKNEPGLPHAGTILITGGLSGLGLETARWLVERGARHLVLIGRRPPSPATCEALRDMESQGARVLVQQADASRREDLARVLALAEATMPPLCGIIHAAGVIDGRLLIEQDAGHVARVLAPKVAGAWHLHELTRDRPLDFCLYYSSISALFGGVGQGSYAAANAFLDALAAHRRSQGLPALSINLGPFAETGMTARMDAGLLRTALVGLELLTPRQGLEALPELLRLGRNQVGLAQIDWATWRQAYPALAEWPFFSDLILPPELVVAHGPGAARQFRETLLAAAPAARPGLLSGYLSQLLGNLLGFNEAIDPGRSILDLGFDSLVAVQFKNRLDAELGAAVSIGQMLEGPSVVELTDRILAGWQAGEDGAPRLEAAVAGGRAKSMVSAAASPWEEGEL